MSTHREHHDDRNQLRYHDGEAAPDPPRRELARMGVARQVKQQRRGYAAAVLRSLAAPIGDDPPPTFMPRCAAASHPWVYTRPRPRCLSSAEIADVGPSNCLDR